MPVMTPACMVSYAALCRLQYQEAVSAEVLPSLKCSPAMLPRAGLCGDNWVGLCLSLGLAGRLPRGVLHPLPHSQHQHAAARHSKDSCIQQ